MSKIKKMSYEDALRELELLTVKIEDPKADLDKLSEDVKRALDLVKYCQLQLRTYEEELQKLIE